jgi:hypothetical protein
MSGVHYHLVIYWLSTKRNMTFDIIWQLQHAVYGIFTMVVCNAHAWDGHETRMQVGENMTTLLCFDEATSGKFEVSEACMFLAIL